MSTEPNDITSPYTTPAVDPALPGTLPYQAVAEASLGARIGNYFIDSIILVLISFVVSLVLGFVSDALGLLGMVAALAYLLLRDALPFLGGQSIGKKLMKVRAVTEDGRPLTGNWTASIVRNVVLLIPFFPIVELIVLATRKDQPLRRLGDQWAKTKVVTVS